MLALKAIQIAFNDATRQASRLDECARQLRDAEKSLNEILGTLQREWSGEAADLFRQKSDILQNKIGRTASDLNTISGAIRRSARDYYDAEQKAIELAQRRSFTGGGGGGGGGGSMGGR